MDVHYFLWFLSFFSREIVIEQNLLAKHKLQPLARIQ